VPDEPFRPRSLDGYGPAVALAAESEVTVLTPLPTVDVVRMEYAQIFQAPSGALQVVENARNLGE
jgi:hypothetical protein